MYQKKINNYEQSSKKEFDLGFDSEKLSYIPNYFSSYIDKGKLPNITLLVARNNEIAHLSSQGYSSVESKKPIQNNSIYRFYSMTKPITSVAIMMLYEKGLLRLEHEVSRYLPEFKDVKVWDEGTIDNYKVRSPSQPMLIKDLLTHTSGLTYGFMTGHPVIKLYNTSGIASAKNPETKKEMDLEEFSHTASSLPLLFDPGSKWHYSISIDILGRVIEVISGDTFDNFLKKYIFNPLNMVDTDFFVPEEKHERFVDCYQELVSKTGNKLKRCFNGGEDIYSKPRNFLSGGGGLCSTLADYANFCQMLLNNGSFLGQQILSPITVNYMRRNHLPNNQTMRDMGDDSFSEVMYDGAGFGLGFSPLIDSVKSLSPVSEGSISWGGMASTFFWVDPKENFFAILLTQLIPSGRYPIRAQTQTLVYSALKDLNKN